MVMVANCYQERLIVFMTLINDDLITFVVFVSSRDDRNNGVWVCSCGWGGWLVVM